MVVLDFFIVNVGLPSIQGRLHAGTTAVEWVVAGYSLTSAIFVISGARLGDRLGHRLLFGVGMGLFTLASAACGAAGTSTELVIARLIQGVGAALLIPAVLSLISTLYTGTDRLRALSAYGTTMGFAAAGGQLIGGALIAIDPFGLGWRSCFLINVPIGVLALALTPVLIPDTVRNGRAGLDLRGAALTTATLVALVLPLVEGRQSGWPLWTWLSLAAAPVLLALLLADQRRSARRGGTPLLDLSLFADRSFSAGLLTQICFWAGQASFFVVLALYLQEGRGMRPLSAGLVFTVLAGAYSVAATIAPKLSARHGRRIITRGAIVLACGHLMLLAAVLEIGTHGSLALLVPGLVGVGAGMGLVLAPLAGTILTSVDPARAGAASGMVSTMQNVGNALGVAVTGVIFFGALNRGYAHAYELAALELAVLLVMVAALTRLLPGPRPAVAVAEPEPVQ
jgi:EmrB/QacA subfamily drug resistance transporter